MCLPFVAAGAAVLGTTLSTTAAAAINVGLTASLVAGLAGSAVSAAGQVQQAKAAEDQGKYEYKVMRYEAELERQKGEVEAVRFGVNARREWGRFMLQQAGTNRDLSFGNVASQAIEFRKFQTFDGEILARNAEARVNVMNLNAENARIRGQNQAAGLRMGAVATGIQGAASAVSSFFSFSRLGSSSIANATRFTGLSSYQAPAGQMAAVNLNTSIWNT